MKTKNQNKKEEKSTVKPVGPYILVALEPIEEKTNKHGLIVNTDEDEVRYRTGKVLRIGTGVMLNNGFRTEFNVKSGDRVLMRANAGLPITDDEMTEGLFVLESDILGILS